MHFFFAFFDSSHLCAEALSSYEQNDDFSLAFGCCVLNVFHAICFSLARSVSPIRFIRENIHLHFLAEYFMKIWMKRKQLTDFLGFWRSLHISHMHFMKSVGSTFYLETCLENPVQLRHWTRAFSFKRQWYTHNFCFLVFGRTNEKRHSHNYNGFHIGTFECEILEIAYNRT